MSRALILSAANHFGIPEDQLVGPRRWKHLVRIRAGIAYVLHYRDNISFPQIGKRLGNRDHSTMIHGVRQVERWMTEHPGLKDFIGLHMGLPKFYARIVRSRDDLGPAEQEPILEIPVATAPRPIRTAKRKAVWDRVEISAGTVLLINEDGNDRSELYFRRNMIAGSRALERRINSARGAAAA